MHVRLFLYLLTQSGDFPISATPQQLSAAPRVTIENGPRIVNFSSGHVFTFDNGQKLEACKKDRVLALGLIRDDRETFRGLWTDVELVFVMSDSVMAELLQLTRDETVDIILCPLPIVQLLKAEMSDPLGTYQDAAEIMDKARTIVRAKRAIPGEEDVISSTKFGK